MVASDPPDAIIYLDSSRISSSSAFFPCDTGSHIIKAWRKGFDLYIDTIKVLEGKYNRVRVILSPTREFVNYKQKKNDITLAKTLSAAVPALIYGTFFKINKDNYQENIESIQLLREETSEAIDLYRKAVSPADIHSAKLNYTLKNQRYLDELDRNKKLISRFRYVTTGGIVALTGSVCFIILKKIPVYEQPVLLSNLSVVPYSDGFASSGLTVIYTLK